MRARLPPNVRAQTNLVVPEILVSTRGSVIR